MQDDSWKKVISGLSLDELKEAQRFINELIPMLQALENPLEVPAEELTAAPVENYGEAVFEEFPPSSGGERREDKRFDIQIEGIYSLIKDEEPESALPVQHLQIKDISKHGIRFVTTQFLLPSNILIIKFHLPSSDTRQLYKNPQKKIYAEVRRVVGVPTPLGMRYQIGAKSIEREEALELLKENEGFTLTGKRLAMKGDMRILIVSIREAQSKHLEEILQNQGYNVYRANQKPHAIALLRKIHCNVVVTDMVTAGIHDFELIKDLKGEFPYRGLVVEVDTVEDWLKISPLGADDYLSKNFNDKEFETTIELLHKKYYTKAFLATIFAKSAKTS